MDAGRVRAGDDGVGRPPFVSALLLGHALLENWRYYDGVMVRQTREGLAGLDAGRALNVVYSMLYENAVQADQWSKDGDAVERLDGWMTCTYAQAVDFIRADQEAEIEERRRAVGGFIA